jgi:hypothetical protein
MNTSNIIMATMIVILAAGWIISSNKLKTSMSREDTRRMLYFLEQFRFSAASVGFFYSVNESKHGARITYSYGETQRYFLEYRPTTGQVTITDELSGISDTRKIESDHLDYGKERIIALLEAGQKFITVGMMEEKKRSIPMTEPTNIHMLNDPNVQPEDAHAE